MASSAVTESLEIVPECGQELVETGDGGRVLPGVLDQAPDPGLLGSGDLANVLGPVLHVAAVADPLDDPRVEGVAPLAQIGKRELPGVEVLRSSRDSGLVGAIAAVQPDPDEADRRRCPVEADLVDLGGQALVVGTQRLQHLPHHLVCLVVAQRHFWRHAGRHPDRQDHISEVLALRATHYPAHGLDDIDDALARLQEKDGVERGHVDALGQALGVREHAADALPRRVPKPRQRLGTDLDVGRAVDVAGLNPHRIGVTAILERLVRDHGEGLRECLRRLDRGRERDRALHRHLVTRELRAALGECVPAADDAGEVVERETGLGIRQLPLERAVDGLLVHREDDHPVVGEQVTGDGIAEQQLVEDRAEHGLVVHRGEHYIGLLRPRLRLVAVDSRRGRHVEPARAGDVRVVVNPRERGLVTRIPEGAGGAVRLVADDQVERVQPLLLRARDHVQ